MATGRIGHEMVLSASAVEGLVELVGLFPSTELDLPAGMGILRGWLSRYARFHPPARPVDRAVQVRGGVRGGELGGHEMPAAADPTLAFAGKVRGETLPEELVHHGGEEGGGRLGKGREGTGERGLSWDRAGPPAAPTGRRPRPTPAAGRSPPSRESGTESRWPIAHAGHGREDPRPIAPREIGVVFP